MTPEELKLLVKVPVSTLESVTGLQEGELLFYDTTTPDNKLKKISIDTFNNLSKSAKPLAPTDPAPTVEGLYVPTESGTYANAGGLIAQDGYYTLFFFDGTTWTKSQTLLPQSTFSTEKLIGKNIANPALRVVGKWVNSAGDIATLANWEIIQHVPVIPSSTITVSGHDISGVTKYVVFEDINKVKIANPTVALNPSPKTFVVPSTCYFISMSIKNTTNVSPTQLQIELGSVATSYEPYTETEIIKEIDNKDLLASYFPDYVAGTYKKNQIFVYSDKIYKSKVNNNTALPTDATKWVNIGGGGSGGSSYDQSLNTTDAVQFSKVTAGEFAVPGTLKKGTLVTPPSGLISGEYWLDQTDSTTNPIIRQKQ